MYMSTKYQSLACVYMYIHIHTYPWSRVLPEKLTGYQLLKNFPAFYGTRKFISTSTRARHLSLPLARSAQFMLPHPTYWGFILILSSFLRLGLPSSLFPLGLPTKILYALLLSSIRATCSAHLILIVCTCTHTHTCVCVCVCVDNRRIGGLRALIWKRGLNFLLRWGFIVRLWQGAMWVYRPACRVIQLKVGNIYRTTRYHNL